MDLIKNAKKYHDNTPLTKLPLSGHHDNTKLPLTPSPHFQMAVLIAREESLIREMVEMEAISRMETENKNGHQTRIK